MCLNRFVTLRIEAVDALVFTPCTVKDLDSDNNPKFPYKLFQLNKILGERNV